MTDDICGAKCVDGSDCQHDAGSCPIPTHSNPNAENPGRPSKMDERAEELVLTAVRAGLKFEDQANHARVHPDTLRRHLCCIDTPRKSTITASDPCTFCENYAQAHAQGAIEVLEDCRPEFRASASFGYKETEKHEHTGEDGGPVEVVSNFSDTTT